MTALDELLARYPAPFRSALERELISWHGSLVHDFERMAGERNALVAEVERLSREHNENLRSINLEGVRDTALEEAAIICETHASWPPSKVTLAAALAAAIRARKGG